MSPRIALGEAMRLLRDRRADDEIVVTTMGAAREWMALGPLHPLDFVLVPSSMGQATSVGLGLALARPDRRVIVANGDGSMLMNLGSLVSIAAEAPRNLTVIIGDNGCYEVTGAQPTPGVAAGVDWVALARACGIEEVARIDDLTVWEREHRRLIERPGPTVIVLDLETVPGGVGPRSPGPARERARRFMAALAAS
ncbi:MAG: thiamine pyrophosphate-dependent enzyme [Gemmatimonadales bacterium]